MPVQQLTIQKLQHEIESVAASLMDLNRYSEFLQHRSRSDKRLREEFLAILAFVHALHLPDDELIELGGETEDFDARIRDEPIEVVQALPRDEHEVRRNLSKGLSPGMYLKHSRDQLQFPDVIIDAINQKHAKNYTDGRHLLVIFDGEYSEEDDEIIASWIKRIRTSCEQGSFKSIVLVERARVKAFRVFPNVMVV